MSGLSSKYDSIQTAKHFSEHYRKVAVIVGVDMQNDTQYSGKFDDTPDDVVAQRYRIRLLGVDPADKPDNKLPVAYPLQLSSGLGAQDSGIIRYAPNTFVYVSKDPNSGAYSIERVVPNHVAALLKDENGESTGEGTFSGFIPGLTVPTDYSFKGELNTAELFNTQAPSDEDIKHDFKSKLPSIKKACDTVNVDGVNDAIQGLIEDVESIKTGIIGEDSFLTTTSDFIVDAQGVLNNASNASLNVGIGTDSFEISIGNAAGDISKIVAALVQKIRKWVLRKITTATNAVIGNVPLTTRYVANEFADKTLNAVSCLFVKVLGNLESMIANILKTFVNKILNATECLIENVIGGIIGNIIGNITGVIQSILSSLASAFRSIGSVIESITDLAGDMLDFVIDILDIFKCPVENLCPDTSTWDFLQGSKPSNNPTLNFAKIFNKAKNITGNVSASVGDVVTSFEDIYDEAGNLVDSNTKFLRKDGSEFDPLDDINAGIIWQNIIDGSCNTGAVPCGPPTVTFFGGDGDGATGNPVVNLAGELIGVEIITPGMYKKPPLVSFDDPCGNGKGAIGKVIVNKKIKTTKDPGSLSEKLGKIGAIERFELWENYQFVTGRLPGFYEKKINEEALSVYGSVLWEELTDFVEGKVLLTGGSGSGFEVIARFQAYPGKSGKPGNTSYSIKKIINTGEGYEIGDILKFPDIKGVAIAEGSRQKQFQLRVLDVTPPIDDEEEVDDIFEISGVFMDDTGYNYEAYPYGDKGGSGRVWANRCQTTVLRANFDWDIPYSNGRVITAYYGDTVTLPGQNPVLIDANFTEEMIPGCIVEGTNPKIKDMTNFDYTRGITYETGIRHQFGLAVDAQNAFSEGYTEQDIRFFLENKFFLRVGPRMREALLDPEWGKIPAFSVTFTAPGCPPGTPEDPNEPPNTGVGDKELVSIIDRIIIVDPGFGYGDGDTIIIGDGDNATGELSITNGAITGVTITNPGIGFTTLPNIRINTNTGYNAVLKPVLRFIDTIDVVDSGFVVPLGTPTLQIIDCVGKV